MHFYIKHLKNSVDKEYNASMRDNVSFLCVLRYVEPLQNFYKLVIQPKTKVFLKEEDKLEIDNNIVTILEVLSDSIVCKSNKIMSKSEFVARKCNDNIKKIQKRLARFIDRHKEEPSWLKFISDNNNNITLIQQAKPSINEAIHQLQDMVIDDKNIKLDDHRNTEVKNLENAEYKAKNAVKTSCTENVYNGITIHENTHVLDGGNNVEIDVDKICFFDNTLNGSQKNAVLAALSGENYKILGPPGTGKTRTILEIILQLTKYNKKVLVCGPSNTSVDNILKKFIDYQKGNIINGKFFRLGSSFKCFDGHEKYNLNFMAEEHVRFLEKDLNALKKEKDKEGKHIFDKINKNLSGNDRSKKSNSYSYAKKSAYKTVNHNYNDIIKDRKERVKKYISNKIADANIVFSTLFSSIKIDGMIFDYVIIDECCQGTEVEVFLNMLMAKNFVLAGDPFQLGPVNETSDQKGLYERLDVGTCFLNQQYRMSDKLIRFSNKYFYDNKIRSKEKDDELAFFDENNIVFVDTFDSYFAESNCEKSKQNKEEAKIINAFVKYLKRTFEKLSIGIITPYSAQVDLVKELIQDFNIKISTVDSFQGQEKDVIVFSMVRSNEDEEIGFLNEIRRTNVAITRCRKGLFVVGNSENFKTNNFYKSFVEFLYENAFCIDPENFYKIVDE